MGPGLDLRVVSGAIVMSGGSPEMVDSSVDLADAVRQSIECRLQTFRNEWFLDETIGVPYFDAGLGQKVQRLDAMRAAIREEILSVPGVTSLISLSVDLDRASRRIVGSFSAMTAQGAVNGMIG